MQHPLDTLGRCKCVHWYLKATVTYDLRIRVSSHNQLHGCFDVDWAFNVHNHHFTGGHCIYFGDNLVS